MNQKEQIRKELNEYLDKYIPRTEIDIYKHVVNFIKKDRAEQLILSGVSDIVHRAELKVLENVSDYIPCEIYSQAVISSQKKRDNVR